MDKGGRRAGEGRREAGVRERIDRGREGDRGEREAGIERNLGRREGGERKGPLNNWRVCRCSG